MAKRFTDTELYDQEWFLTLSPKMKCAWEWLCKRCDPIGVWHISMTKISFEVGEPITLEELISTFKVQPFGDDQLFIPGFVSFQYGDAAGRLSPKNRFHLSISDKLLSLGLPEPEWKSIDEPNDSDSGHPVDTLSIGVGSTQGRGRGKGQGNNSSEEGTGEKQKPAKKAREVWKPTSATEAFDGMTDDKRKAWADLYDDAEYVQRTIQKAFSYYRDDKPEDLPKTRAGWSRAFSFWLDKGWAQHRRDRTTVASRVFVPRTNQIQRAPIGPAPITALKVDTCVGPLTDDGPRHFRFNDVLAMVPKNLGGKAGS